MRLRGRVMDTAVLAALAAYQTELEAKLEVATGALRAK